MSTNARLVLAVVLSLGVVLAFGMLAGVLREGENAGGGMPAADADASAQATVASAAATGVSNVSGAPAQVAGPVVPPVSAPAAAPQPPAAADLAVGPAVSVAAAPPAARTEKIENEAVEAIVSSHRGAVVSWKLKEPRFSETVAGKRVPLDLAATPNGVMGLYCHQGPDPQGRYVDVCPNEYLLRRQGDAIVLEGVPQPGVRVRVRQTLRLGAPGNPYVFHRSILLAPANPGEVLKNLVIWTPVAHPMLRGEDRGWLAGWLVPAINLQHGLCRVGDELGRTVREEVSAGSRAYGSIDWVGVENMYFLSAIGFAVKNPPNRRDFCVLDILGDQEQQPLRATLELTPVDLVGERTFELTGHLGPKTLDLLRSLPALEGLDEAVDYGWFAPLCILMLRIMEFFHSLVSAWGLAIILLTVLVKVVLLPLTHWSTVSMRRMSALKPLIDEINEKYKDDKTRRNQAIMDLYRTHKVNPLGGCFPILLQMPIWIALYQMLVASTELYRVSFLYLPDLTQADPYYVLPLVLGVSMFVQQKLTPTTMDSAQAKVLLYGMPILFTLFMLFLPSGLNLYIFTNTLLSIAQQQIYNRFVPPPVLQAAKGPTPLPVLQVAKGPTPPPAAEPKPAATAAAAGRGRLRGRSRRKR